MSPKWNIAVCGLNCTTCDFYRAAKGDTEKQQKIIEWFREDYGKTLTPIQTMCQGCRAPDKIHWSPDCKIRQCSKEKQVNNCTECPEFICNKLEAFQNNGHQSHHQAIENLKQIKKTGLQQWIKNNTSK